MIFQRHPIYLVTHIILGIIGYFYPKVLYLTIGYQLAQYFFNIRFFLFEGAIKSGNSLQHTSVKLSEVAFGYILAMLYKCVLHQKLVL
jgi:hypothetical protein